MTITPDQWMASIISDRKRQFKIDAFSIPGSNRMAKNVHLLLNLLLQTSLKKITDLLKPNVYGQSVNVVITLSLFF